MKELRHILTILQSKHLQEEPTLDDLSKDDGSLLSTLALNILRNNYQTDREAARDLYGTVYDKHTFEVLKSKLRQRALTSLLLYDITDSDNSPRNAAKHRLQRQMIQANLLLMFGARPAGIKLLHKIENQSSLFLLTDIRLQSLWILRSHYWYSGETDQYDKASRQISTLINLLSRENKAEELYCEATIAFVKSKAKHFEMKAFVTEAITALDGCVSELPSFIIPINRSRLGVLLYQLSDDHSAVIEESKKAMKMLREDKRLFNQTIYNFFLMTLCESLLLQRKYEELYPSLAEIRKHVDYTNPNRIAVERIAYLAHLGSGKFTEAERVLTDVLSLPYFSLPLEHHREEWMLFSDYMNVVKIMQDIRRYGLDSLKSKEQILSLPKSLKLPIFSKDKLGVNIPIVVLDVIVLILSRQHKKLLQSDKTLDNYIYRYLASNMEFTRSVAFLKLLRIIIKEDFEKASIRKKAESHLKVITEQNDDRLEAIEIVPYDVLWDLLIETV